MERSLTSPIVVNRLNQFSHSALLSPHSFEDLIFRTSGKQFNLRRLSTNSKYIVYLMRYLMYADAVNIVVSAQIILQQNRFSIYYTFGLRVSQGKTKVMFTPSPSVPYKEPTILLRNIRLEVFDTFPYHGSTRGT